MTEMQGTAATAAAAADQGAAAGANAYDQMLYPGGSHADTWPDHVAAVATLLGMRPPVTENCRVLEVGCGVGGNLIAMALSMPNARFVGIDAAERPVEQARGRALAVGLDNVEFRRLNILDAGPDLGQFDYIIAHGVYSWVPADVRDRLLALCKAHLAPDGVAFVSYNAMPGGATRQMARAIAQYHLSHTGVVDPASRVPEVRRLFKILADARLAGAFERPVYRQAIQEELNTIAPLADGFVYHDTISEVNDAFYFHEFAAHAQRHGLQYLGEANVTELLNPHFPPQLRQAVESLPPGDVVGREQYADFIKGRMFRQTLLCHDGVALGDRAVQADRVRALFAGSNARSDPPADPADALVAAVRAPNAPVRFFRDQGTTATVTDPVAKAALVHLRQMWPAFAGLDEVVAAARHYSGAREGSFGDVVGPEGDARNLAEVLFQAYLAKVVALRARRPRLAAQVSERPVASPLARLQAAESPDGYITSLLGENLRPPPQAMARRLLPLLDGTRDRAALLDEVVSHARAGQLDVLDPYNSRVEDPDRLRELLRGEVDLRLRELAINALLIA